MRSLRHACLKYVKYITTSRKQEAKLTAESSWRLVVWTPSWCLQLHWNEIPFWVPPEDIGLASRFLGKSKALQLALKDVYHMVKVRNFGPLVSRPMVLRYGSISWRSSGRFMDVTHTWRATLIWVGWISWQPKRIIKTWNSAAACLMNRRSSWQLSNRCSFVS